MTFIIHKLHLDIDTVLWLNISWNYLNCVQTLEIAASDATKQWEFQQYLIYVQRIIVNSLSI